jgi:hypothetical protein
MPISRNQTHGVRPSRVPPDKPNFDASGFNLLYAGACLKHGRFQASDDLKAPQLGPGEHLATLIRGDEFFAVDTTSQESGKLAFQRFGLEGILDRVVIPAINYLDCLVGDPDLTDFTILNAAKVKEVGYPLYYTPRPHQILGNSEFLCATLGRQEKYAVLLADRAELENLTTKFGAIGQGIRIYRLTHDQLLAVSS